jgi:hypothetical protein
MSRNAESDARGFRNVQEVAGVGGEPPSHGFGPASIGGWYEIDRRRCNQCDGPPVQATRAAHVLSASAVPVVFRAGLRTPRQQLHPRGRGDEEQERDGEQGTAATHTASLAALTPGPRK